MCVSVDNCHHNKFVTEIMTASGIAWLPLSVVSLELSFTSEIETSCLIQTTRINE